LKHRTALKPQPFNAAIKIEEAKKIWAKKITAAAAAKPAKKKEGDT